MVHRAFLACRRRKIEGAGGAVLAAALAVGLPVAAGAAGKPRIVSINLCTDQLLVATADPEQILGLSPYFRDAVRSWSGVAAGRAYPILSGTAEEVLLLRPDLVLGGRFTRRATRDLLRAQGLRVEDFDAVRSIEDAKGQIRRIGALTGHPDRASEQIARIDAAADRARAAAARTPLRVLPLHRRGWVPGSDSLITSLLRTVGLSNAAGELGLTLGGHVTLEAVVMAKPDLLLATREDDRAEDQGRAFLLHPALARLYPPERRIVVPERLTVCGGPMLADALDHLADEVTRLGTGRPRPPGPPASGPHR